nr:DddA-like double-stranded DNA deaminase toxin [Actinokineospora iranica]
MASIEELTARLAGELARLTALKAAVMAAVLPPLDEVRQAVDALLHGTATHETIATPLAHAHQGMGELYQALTVAQESISAAIAHQGVTTPATRPPQPTRTSTPAPPPAVSAERIDQLRRELPPDVIPEERRPRGTPRPKTHGRWIDPDGNTHTEVSGKDEKYEQAVAYFDSTPDQRVPLRAYDVEMKLAVHMRVNNIQPRPLQ